MDILLEEDKFMKENLKLLCKITNQIRRMIQTLRFLLLFFSQKKYERNAWSMNFLSIYECKEDLRARQSGWQCKMHSQDNVCISENLGAICDKVNLILLLKEQKIEFLMYGMLIYIKNFQLKWLKESCKSHHSFPMLDCRGKNYSF